MDFSKIVIKYKLNAKGTHYIAYCDEYPSVQGIGPSEGHATANFWKAFNANENKTDHQNTLNKKAIKESEEKSSKDHSKHNKKKIAA
ncbi:MAG: hypothetical protein HQK49_00375 [Oligoflexia bacterium]|nr:hypothetical protein [Oligoflexia bacterium]